MGPKNLSEIELNTLENYDLELPEMESNECTKIMKNLVLQWILGPKSVKNDPNEVSGQPGPNVFLTAREKCFF